MSIYFSEHALFQLKRRNIFQKLIRQAIESPDEVLSSFRGRKLRRIRIHGKLLEVVTKTEGSRITIVTGYYLKEEEL